MRTHLSSNAVAGACLVSLVALIGMSSPANAQSYPDKPIHLISPSPPGGGTDTTARLVANKVTELTKWQFVVDTRPGAGGNIGLNIGAKSAADGYTLVMGETSNLTVNQYLYKHPPLDPEKELTPVSLIGRGALVFVVRADKPYKTLGDVVAASRKSQMSFASSGSGTVGHLVTESFKKKSGAQFLHVPYKGAGPAMTDLLGGQVDVYFASLTAALPMVKTGKLKALAVTSTERIPSLPDVPTLAESGFPGLDYYVIYGLVAPARTPAAVVSALNREVNRALKTPELKVGLMDRGVEAMPMTPDEFGAYLTKERARWRVVVKDSGATVD
ncbi:Bug family tripartite tricarboxylate transporter substrate binding protein [Cupriavidus plantarum]|uniref:Bug family tripartite tricarboxylate transporter substrate binding protein n=1 Tax=Cupriavidus plantarum TaxID=942865 RepID=UPI000E25DFED|nr:tripartite tricarboxylate transporter substrate binding protein [Cupriavidus plantarum]REE93780.1 tripartite-type tricarboxylate transporter receptor subunit TctC [Cupriavidus plantarum]